MRIIAGSRRGLKLKPPNGDAVRPTTDRVKESVFNIIGRYLPAERVLDLFAGSGALGIEALSRYSEHCVFVDFSRKSFLLVKHNIELSALSESAELVFSDAIDYLNNAKEPFDIIFLDPPYNKGLISPVLDIIYRRKLLTDDGIVVIETEKGGESAEHFGFSNIRCAVYGRTVITILKRGGFDEDGGISGQF